MRRSDSNVNPPSKGCVHALASTVAFVCVIGVCMGQARAGDALEPLIDALVAANFNNDYGAAGEALRRLVEFELAAGIEPSGKLAVVQVRETQVFAARMEQRLKEFIDGGFPILAAMELARHRDVLRFEPAGAARAEAARAMVDVAGQAQCEQLKAQAGGRARAGLLAGAVCRTFGMGHAAGASGEEVKGPLSPVAAPVSTMVVTGAVKGFLSGSDLQGALLGAARDAGLLADGAELLLSCQVAGTSILTRSSIPGVLDFEYGIQVPYSEMQEYCEWSEEVTTRVVEKDGRKKRVTETSRVCNKSQRPVDLVRVEKKTRQVPGTKWKRTAIWQVKAAFDDGDGCVGQKSFDGQRVDEDFEHGASDPVIGLRPDPVMFPPEADVAGDVARQLAAWLTGAHADCLRARWCSIEGRDPDLENVLRCAGIPGGDRRAIDAAIVTRFGVTLNELMAFLALQAPDTSGRQP